MRRHLTKYLRIAAAAAIAAFHFIPIYILLMVSFKKGSDFSSRWCPPLYLYLDNYIEVLRDGDLIKAFGNTVLITVCAAFLVLFLGAICAYPIARTRSRLSSLITNIVLAVMMIPSLSDELDEAAAIDGCRDFRIFFSVIMPQLQPVIASVLILTGIKIWNDYKYALYFLQDNDMETITLFISKFFSDFSVELNEAAAAAFLAILPVCVLFLFLQKYFITGLSEGSIK